MLTHYHAVRTLGAAAFEAEHVVASRVTADLIAERASTYGATLFFAGPTFFANMLRAELPADAAKAINARRVESLDEMLEQCDIVTIVSRLLQS